MINLGSLNATTEVFIYPTSKRVSNVLPWQQEFTCFFLFFFLQSGKTDLTFISFCASLPLFQPDHFYSFYSGISGRNLQRQRLELCTDARSGWCSGTLAFSCSA